MTARALPALLLTVAAPALAQPGRLGGGDALDVSLARIVAALVLCVMLAAVAALLLKRGGGRIDLSALRALAGPRAERRIEVIETRRISPHADLCLLRCGGREFLILCSEAAQQVLRDSAAMDEDRP